MIEIGKFHISMQGKIHEFSIVNDGTIAERIYDSKISFVKSKLNYMFNGIFIKAVPNPKIGTEIITNKTKEIFQKYNAKLAAEGKPIIDFQKLFAKRYGTGQRNIVKKKKDLTQDKEFANYFG